jgi:haloalkane dehalogenase
MEALRTPEERFVDLPGFGFAPNYVELPDGGLGRGGSPTARPADGGALRLHYLDEGRRDGGVVLLMHGEPSWCFLYRKMIPVLADAGLRVIAPDLIGFGRSDKPVRREDYTYERHVGWIRAFIEALDLREVTLVGQDWGGLIGLRVAAEAEPRFARIVAANTGLPTGEQRVPDVFKAWQRFSQETPVFAIGQIVAGGCSTDLSEAVIAAYDAPFPDERYKAGARQFPLLVPTAPDDPAAPANRRAWEVFSRWEKPFLTAFSDSDPITHGAERPFQKLVPGAQGQAHVVIAKAGHFLQEDRGEELARVVVNFIQRTR